MKKPLQNRDLLKLTTAGAIGWVLLQRIPFPEEETLLRLVSLEKPYLLYGIKWTYFTLLFTTPYIGLSLLFSIVYIFLHREGISEIVGKLPLYPEVAKRDKLFVVVGEVHQSRRFEPSENPHWLTIPDRGLFTGLAVFGAVGSGKTSCCIVPFAEQVLGYRAEDREKRVGGLVLEVKGDFCQKLHGLLTKYHRQEDYIDLSLEGEYRYNPLHNGQDAYALAFGIASLLNNLFGRGKEPFWQQAYTNLVKFIILLHKVLYDYVTLFDIYECAINPKLLEQKIEEGNQSWAMESVSIEIDAFEEHPVLDDYGFVVDKSTKRMKAPSSEILRACLESHGIAYSSETEKGDLIHDERKQQQFEAVKRWFSLREETVRN